MLFERHSEELISLPKFYGRMLRSFMLASSIVLSALAVGAIGYHGFAQLNWVDAILNASMILTGMGPVTPMNSTGAKLFASGYALFSGVVFLSAVSIVIAPLFHRILHHFHLDAEDEGVGKPD